MKEVVLKKYQEMRMVFEQINDILFSDLNESMCPKKEQ